MGSGAQPYLLLFQLTGATGNIFKEASSYMNTLFYGTLFFILNFILNGFLAAQGNKKSYRNTLHYPTM